MTQPFRSLKNYKEMHAKTAEKLGVSEEFRAARTLTQAKKILWGVKEGQRPLPKKGRKGRIGG